MGVLTFEASAWLLSGFSYKSSEPHAFITMKNNHRGAKQAARCPHNTLHNHTHTQQTLLRKEADCLIHLLSKGVLKCCMKHSNSPGKLSYKETNGTE